MQVWRPSGQALQGRGARAHAVPPHCLPRSSPPAPPAPACRADWTHHSNGNGNGHANGWHASGGQSVEALQAEVADLRRQLAARGEEAAAFSRACDQLRAERDSLAHQLSLAQQQLAAANEEKAVLAAAAAKSERNIHLLRQVGQLLSSMHE